MKCATGGAGAFRDWSLPVRGAWVEIVAVVDAVGRCMPSLPVRGAWVEIGVGSRGQHRHVVAPRAGSVG